MYGLGHRDGLSEHVAIDLAHRPASALVGAGAPTMEARDWRFLDDHVANQSASSTCVAQSGSMAVYMRGQAAALRGEGYAVPRPSVLQAYFFGQLEDQLLDGIATERRKIVDEGMRARSMLVAWETFGIAAESHLPFDIATLRAVVNAPSAEEASKLLPFDLDVAGADAKLTGWHRINDAARSEEIALALDIAHFPIVPVKVYEDFMSWSGPATYTGPAGAYVGGHAMTAVGFRPGETLLKNSWGDGWGSGGYVWVSNSYIDQFGLDCWVIDAAPPLH